MKVLIIDTPNNTAYFALFYVLAFLTSFIILIVEGRRRKFPTLPWLIVIASGFIFFVLGCRLLTLSAQDWHAIANNQPLDHSTGMVMLGGLLLSVPAIFIAKRIVHLNTSVLDAYAFVLPVGMCLQRIGCFLDGCCFGTATSGFGVQYGRGTSPFTQHYLDGSIPSSAIHSLSVHPVQLYESLGCLLIVLLLYKIRRTLTSVGSLFFASGLGYYLVRFITEFFRDANAHAIKAPSWFGLNTIQWLMLVLIIGSLVIIVVKEQGATKKPDSHHHPFSFQNVFYFFILSIVFLVSSKWLSATEVLVVYLVLFTTSGYLVTELFKSITVPKLRIASLSLLFSSLGLMSQTYPEQSENDSTRISYNTISVGALAGNQTYSVGSITVTDCNGAVTTVPEFQYINDYSLGALGFSRTIQKPNNSSITFGINGFKGKHTESNPITTHTFDIYGINPYFQADYRSVGFGVGAHVGNFTFIPKDNETTSVTTKNFFPQLYFRFGRLNTAFGELSLARNFPGSFPGTYFQASFGFGLIKKHKYRGAIKIGTSTSTGIFFATSHFIGKHIVLEPYLGLAPSFITKGDYDKATTSMGAISLHYKFNKKPRP